MFKNQIANKLVITRQELFFQNKEKNEYVAELIIATKERLNRNKEKEKRTAEFGMVNKELVLQTNEKEKLEVELTIANEKLKKSKNIHEEYILSLKEMMYMTSHQVRQPIAQILGLADLLEAAIDSPEELLKITGLIKESAHCLNDFTQKLTNFIYEQEIKAQSNQRNPS